MNKKFSTLVASLLLASSAGTYAQVTPNTGVIDAAIDVVGTGINATVAFDIVAEQTNANPGGGYVKNKAYILGENIKANPTTAKVLTVETSNDGVNTLVYKPVANTLTGVNRAMWVLQNIEAPAGAIAPKYLFVNKATNVVLSLDQAKAIEYGDAAALATAPSTLTGEMDWLSAPSYKDPSKENNALYVSASNDNVLALVAKDISGEVYLAKMSKATLADDTKTDIIRLKPYTVDGTTGVFTLSPNELNTMLGINGPVATKDSYFRFSFTPAATVKGEENLLGVDLQAVAVDQFGKKYEDKEETMVFPDITDEAYYASLYPLAASGYEVDGITPKFYVKYSDRTNPDRITAFKEKRAQWVAFKNRDGKYLVVDTLSVGGTDQDQNLRLSFAFDDLYNTSKSSRFRDPRSFLFKVDYNPASGNVEIVSMGYLSKKQGTKITDAFDQAAYNESQFKAPALAIKSEWYTNDAFDNVTTTLTQNYIIKAALGATTEVTLGTKANNNQFTIKLGTSGLYQPTSMANRAYLLKIVGSKDAKKIGKYWIDNLYGTFEEMEQAQRQNFQDMPAAQWVLTSTSSLAGAPVTIKNREFGNAPSSVPSTGILYGVAGQSKQAFFMGGDTLQFIDVEKQNVAELGYKYLSDEALKESTFTFNYLHELAMDKPINTVNDVDSLVWVDKDGSAMKFQLERVIDDTYGYNGNLSAVKQLMRTVYYIKVNDASKLQNDRRYLTYDSKVKKYVVSNLTPDIKNEVGEFYWKKNPTAFFLKENNEVADGECYYTLVTADIQRVLTALDDHDAKYMVNDEGINGKASASWGEYTDELTGQKKTGWFVSNPDDKEFEELVIVNIPNRYYGDYKVSVDNNTLNLVNGLMNDGQSSEVANSAFSVVKDANPLYRRFNTAFEGVASDTPDTVKFYRVNATSKEYLYEDANSVYSKDKNFNFLGVEGKGDNKKAAMYVDTAYVNRGTVMPQYLIALAPTVVKADTLICQECGLLNCEHTKITRHSVTARFLINLQDSVNVNAGSARAKYQWNKQYTRLGFVDATHIGDSLIIKNSVYTGDKRSIEVGKPATYASNDTINLSGNKHNNAVFQFRLFKTGSNDFLIESESVTGIAPEQGGWVKVQNGVPVIAKYNSYKEAGLDAEIFNVDAANGDNPTSNGAVDTNNVSVTGGNGTVTIQNAAGEVVKVTTVLGQELVSTVLTSDNAQISVSATGVVFVTVAGETTKVVVK